MGREEGVGRVMMETMMAGGAGGGGGEREREGREMRMQKEG